MPIDTAAVHRIEVHPTAGDPVAESIVRDAAAIGVHPAAARSARVYLIEADLDRARLDAICDRLLADPVIEHAVVGVSPPSSALIEVHPLPGVMDPAAGSVREALSDLFGIEAEVSTGVRYDFEGITPEQADTLARRLLANTVIQAIHTKPFHPAELPKGHEHESPLTHVPLRDLDDAALERLSREAHLFLSLDEMRAIRDEYRALGREPTDIELETLAQTWSEHCVHKTLKSTIIYRNEEASKGGPSAGEGSSSHRNDPINWADRPGHTVNPDGSITIDNLLKSTVAAATHELIEEGLDWTLSVFVDNAGIIEFDEDHAVCVKVETHNHPSAIEPYGGAATGIGGCIRDIIGTGLAAKPIASTDVFCVAYPDRWESDEATKRRSDAEGNSTPISDTSTPSSLRRSVAPSLLPPGCLHPRRILSRVVAGVRDYGNRMGIPTVNGAVWFDDRYVGNPLVFCGSIGVMPRGENDRMISGEAGPGDRIIAIGGRTGRDGIHGATFSSAELTDTHADEFAHAVQIGNPIEEKRVLDAILRARDYVSDEPRPSGSGPLFTAITDCGAGGFSSAVGEMGEKIGAEVHLDRAPLKYPGLTHTEIWISEAQERMVLAVPPENLPALRKICDEEHVELADLGHFGTPDRELILNFRGVEVGRLPMAFLHNGIPLPTREAVWKESGDEATKRRSDEGGKFSPGASTPSSLRHSVTPSLLLTILSHPNTASKHRIIRQYDHEVQGNTVIKPLAGPAQRGPMDAAVIEPVPGSGRGLAVACGLATDLEHDPYLMALAAIDECVRNLVCVGADPDRIAILDNFCWPSCNRPENLASLVRAAEGCYDGAKAYRTPFISGKDSLNNQFTTEAGETIEIPPTLLISGVGIVRDLGRCTTMDAKQPGDLLVLIAPADPSPTQWTRTGPAATRLVADAIARGLVRSAHDVSDGGLLGAVAEMLIAGSTPAHPIGAAVDLAPLTPPGESPHAAAFDESPCRYVIEIPRPRLDDLNRLAGEAPLAPLVLGELDDTGVLRVGGEQIDVETLAAAWLGVDPPRPMV